MRTARKPNSVLILIRGLPGSGKSYLTTALQSSVGEDRVVVLDPDSIDLSSKEYVEFSAALSHEGVDVKLHPYRWSRARAHQAITEHKIIIWNQGFTNLDGFHKTITNLQTFAAEHDTQLPVLVIEVEISHSIAKVRVAKREQQGGHGVPDKAFARFINDYTSFADQGYKTIIVSGEDDVSMSVESVMKALKDML